MLLKQDFYFTYKNVLRFYLLQKCDFFLNSFELPFLTSLLLYFSVSELEDLDDGRAFNYFFLFRFFFGKKAFLTKFDSSFRLNRTFYSFTIYIFFQKRNCFFPLFFLVNDLLAFSSDKYIKIFFMPHRSGCSFFLRFFDMNLFLEKKTNSGLYYLYDNLNFKFFFKLSGWLPCDFLLSTLKVLK
jgi:hypothetical protein